MLTVVALAGCSAGVETIADPTTRQGPANTVPSGAAGPDAPTPTPTAPSSTATTGDAIPSRQTEKWRLYWSDEFDDGSLDHSRWSEYHSTYGYQGGGQLQCHTPKNVSQAAGRLTITAKREPVTCPGDIDRDYSSGFVGSREAGRHYPLFGRYEARVRVPHGQGVGAAFWLRRVGGASHAEVDVMEIFHAQQPGKVTQSVHVPKASTTRLAKAHTTIEQPIRGTGAWHRYAVEIEPLHRNDHSQVRFRFFVDGHPARFAQGDTTDLEFVDQDASSWTVGVDPEEAWDIALSVPVGGSWWGDPMQSLGYLAAGLPAGAYNPDRCSLSDTAPVAGPSSCRTSTEPDGSDDIWFAKFPARFEVDWVRVYTR